MYIDEDYVKRFMRPGQLSGSLVYGGATLAMTGSMLQQYISSSCSFVDVFIGSAGVVPVPLTDPPEIIRELAAERVIFRLLEDSNCEIPPTLIDRMKDGQGMLLLFASGKLLIPGATESNVGAAAGGHSITDNSDGSATEPTLSRAKLSRAW